MGNHKTISIITKDKQSLALIGSMMLCVIAMSFVVVSLWYI
jgi:hypothetical protein